MSDVFVLSIEYLILPRHNTICPIELDLLFIVLSNVVYGTLKDSALMLKFLLISLTFNLHIRNFVASSDRER